MKRILINATQREELRVAIVDGQKLHDLDIETAGREQRKSNVYKGRITRVEASLEACFVDYGGDRHGFLPLKEISPEYFKKEPGSGRVNIAEVLSEGQELIVQVEKEERGTKGAALTTFISLAGRYLVLMPNNPRAGGVSRRIEGEERDQARKSLNSISVPDGVGVIMRTNGIDRSAEELQWDTDYLVEIWTAISAAAADKKAPFLIYQESNIILRALRDYLRPDIGEILIDNMDLYEEARLHMQHVMPSSLPRLKLYADDTPLFSRYQVESQIESAHQREVHLPSGGAIVIDHTEALTSIDINSARSTGGKSIEDTALHTNLEAADEIARQLRLRDLGGLIVIDFIDMAANKNQREVENRLRDAVDIDRARVQLGRISRFGLLEMSRQRLRPSLGEHTQLPCPRCTGQGHIRSIESLSLSILRLLEEESMKDRTARVIAQLPVDIATYLLNEKRQAVANIELRCKVHVMLVPNTALETPHFDITRLRRDQMPDTESVASYSMAQDFTPESEEKPSSKAPPKPVEQAAVRAITPSSPAPASAEPEKPVAPSIWKRLMAWLGLDGSDDDQSESDKPKRSRQQSGQGRARKTSSRSGSGRGEGRGEGRGGKSSGRRSGRSGGGNTDDGRKGQQKRSDNAQDGRKKSASAGGKDKPNNDKDKPTNDGQSKSNQPKAADGKPAQGGDDAANKPARRRRRRGGRNRNRRKQEGAPENASDAQGDTAAPNDANSGAAKQKDAKPAADKPKESQPKQDAAARQDSGAKADRNAPANRPVNTDSKPTNEGGKSQPTSATTAEGEQPAADSAPTKQSAPPQAKQPPAAATDTPAQNTKAGSDKAPSSPATQPSESVTSDAHKKDMADATPAPRASAADSNKPDAAHAEKATAAPPKASSTDNKPVADKPAAAKSDGNKTASSGEKEKDKPKPSRDQLPIVGHAPEDEFVPRLVESGKDKAPSKPTSDVSQS